MSNLNEYLAQKREAVLRRNEYVKTTNAGPNTLRAQVTAEGRSGVRRIRIREFQVISDSDTNFAGYNLGPASPELQLGTLGSCLTHVFLIHASIRQVPLESLEVEVSGEIHPQAGKEGYENVPVYPHNIEYTVHISSPASHEEVTALYEAVERACPILNLLINPQQIKGILDHKQPAEAVSEVVTA